MLTSVACSPQPGPKSGRTVGRASVAADADLLASDATPVHPMRVYGELLKALDDDAVVGGAESGGTGPGDAMKLAADNVQTVVLPDCGHFVAEEAPQEMLAALTAFLIP